MPGVSLPNEVEVSYNDYQFGVMLEPVDISIRYVYDQAGRVVIYHVYTIRLRAKITPEGSSDTDNHMAELKATLCEPAGHLRVLGTGFDDLDVNPPGGGGVRDVKWGPKPQVLATKQIGDNQAWEITWQCEVAIAPCPDEATSKRPLSWNYNVRWSVDRSGLQTRYINGTVSIAQTRRNVDSKTVEDNADRLREAVAEFGLISGFRRIPGSFDLSEDRNTLRFSVTDEQLPSKNTPPPGIIDWSSNHDVESTTGFAKWIGTISASYEVARNQPKALAFYYFQRFIFERLQLARNAKYSVVPLQLSLSEPEVNGKMTARFTLRYFTVDPNMAIGAGPNLNVLSLRGFLGNTGLWTQPADSGWLNWSKSMVDAKVFSSRGVAGLGFRTPDDDVLLDICDREVTALQSTRRLTEEEKLVNAQFRLDWKRPRPNESWLEYRLRFRIIPRTYTAVMNLLPKDGDPVKRKPPKVDVDAPGKGYLPDYEPAAKPRGDVIIQERSRPIYLFEMRGEASRAGYTIDMPRPTSIGGRELVPLDDGGNYFDQETISNFMTPIAKARWRSLYVLTGIPTKAIQPPPNPLYGTTAQAGGGGLDGFVVSVP